jgi:hypothetical protein
MASKPIDLDPIETKLSFHVCLNASKRVRILYFTKPNQRQNNISPQNISALKPLPLKPTDLNPIVTKLSFHVSLNPRLGCGYITA